MMKKSAAFIVILNWNGKEYLGPCLSSVCDQVYEDYQVIVVDNGSTDGSVEFIKARYRNVEVMVLDKNYGFAKANNIGMKRALSEGARFIALLNNDTVVTPGWLGELVKAMESGEKIGICAPKMLRMDDHRILDSTGHVFAERIRICDRGSGELDAGQYDKQLDVVGACAGACLYRAEMLEEIGLFDEGFGLIYFEDAEMSWRAYRRGWKAHYVPLSVVYHKGRASLGMNKEVRDNFQEHLDRNFIKMVKLHATSSQKAWATLLWMKEAFMQGAVSLFSGKTEGPDYKRRLVLLWSR